MVDTSKQDAIYQQQLDQAGKDRELLLQNAGMASSAALRRNASLAAMSGASVGGGAYLGGQRQAMMAGNDATRQAMLQSGNQYQQIFSGGYQGAANAAGANQNAANSAGQFNTGATNSAGQFNADNASQAARDQYNRQGEVDSTTAAAGGEAFANQKTTDLTRMQDLIKGDTTVDFKNKRGAEYEEYSKLAAAAQTAGTQEEYARAIAELQAFYERKRKRR
jgi:hypothetical protein